MAMKRRQHKPMGAAKCEMLLARYGEQIQQTSKELATNFNWSARDIINLACYEIGITREQWDELSSYRIEKEQGVK